MRDGILPNVSDVGDGGIDAVDELEAAIRTLDVRDGSAVRALALKIEALGDPDRAAALCARSRALKAAVGKLRADALSALLARDARDEFIRLTADVAYMNPVDLSALRIPRYVSVEPYRCKCGVELLVPYDRQGGPGFGFECPHCTAPYLARPAYQQGQYRLMVEVDTRPAKKRKKRQEKR